MRNMYNEITLKEKENLYLRKQSKCTKGVLF